MNGLARWRKPLIFFAISQPTTQILNLVTGFLLLRWLSVEDYAMYSVAFAFQSAISQLSDLGFSSSIMALVGINARDPVAVGRYLEAARHLRARMMTAVLIGAVIIFPFVTQQQHWSAGSKVMLIVAISTGVIAQGWMIYSTPLLINRSLNTFYRPQIIIGIGRLGITFVLYITNLLSAVLCTWVGVIALAINGWFFRKSAKPYYSKEKTTDPDAKKEMLKYLAPLIPGIIFTALQGQITVGIITLFGSTRNIAEVAALGRLGQIFIIFGAANSILLAPYISSLPPNKFFRRYIQILIGSISFLIVLAIFSFSFPNCLLWILGSKYSNLKELVGWVVVTSCISQLSGVLWTLHSGQRWIYWWSTGLYIGLVLMTQILSAIWLDLSQTKNVITFGIFTALAILISHISVGVYSFKRLI